MLLTSSVADALGVLTIVLVAILILLGLCSVIYSVYLHRRIGTAGSVHLSYFGRPWIIRVVYVCFALCWGLGEIIRLSLLRRSGRIFGSLSSKGQENLCSCYIVLNLGFTEPCLFLTLALLLRASLQNSAPLSQNWTGKTLVFILLFGLPMLILQLAVVLIEPRSRQHPQNLPSYFIETAASNPGNGLAACTYPLFGTILLGLFAVILTCYLLWLGKQILHWVINRVLLWRVYTLILTSCSLFPFRVLLLGLSVLPKPGSFVFDALVFLAFFSLLCCMVVGICLLVCLPAADSLALTSLQRPEDIEARRTRDEPNDDSIPLIPFEDDSPGRGSSDVRGSISFRSMRRDETCGGSFLELSLFATSPNSSLDSPRPLGWRMMTAAPQELNSLL